MRLFGRKPKPKHPPVLVIRLLEVRLTWRGPIAKLAVALRRDLRIDGTYEVEDFTVYDFGLRDTFALDDAITRGEANE